MDRIEALRRHIPEIVEDLPVRLVYLHGSVARGEATPLSDVDLALVCDEGLSPRERLEVILRVSAELARRAGIAEADVRVVNDAPLVLRGRVVCEGVLLYARDEADRIAYETRTRDEYFDFLPFHRRLQEAFLKNVREQGLLYGRP
ncbi:MAG TPA: nucleotidyltransferase domain-containing protein [Chloroflexi bacterium]|nr:nucleotidyltransferase domain-containing protein [Chloroflexota bacterium]